MANTFFPKTQTLQQTTTENSEVWWQRVCLVSGYSQNDLESPVLWKIGGSGKRVKEWKEPFVTGV